MATEPSPIADQSSGLRSQPPPPVVQNAVNSPSVAWKKPSGTGAAGLVIADEHSWPALSEATRNQPKSAAVPPPASQAIRNQSKSAVASSPMSTSQAHLISNPKKNSNTNQNHKPSGSQTSTHSRRSKRGGGSGSGPSQNGVNHHPRPLPVPRPPPPLAAVRTPPPPPPPFPSYPIYRGPFGPLPPPGPFFFPPSFDGNSWERGPVRGFSPQPPPVGDQHFQRNFNPRGSFVGRPRGDGAGNSGHVARRDHHRDRNGSHKGFARSSPAPPPLPPFPMLPIGPDPVGFDMPLPYSNYPPPPPDYLTRFPPPVPLPPFVVRPMVADLPSLLIKQIDHYFSDDNLAKDTYLRSNMDDEGWVDIAIIADFPMVKQKTTNLQLILDSLKDSTVVEVQDNHIRRRNDWRKWLISAPQFSTGSTSQAQADSTEKVLTNSLQSVVLADEISCDDDKADLSSNVASSDVAT